MASDSDSCSDVFDRLIELAVTPRQGDSASDAATYQSQRSMLARPCRTVSDHIMALHHPYSSSSEHFISSIPTLNCTADEDTPLSDMICEKACSSFSLKTTSQLPAVKFHRIGPSKSADWENATPDCIRSVFSAQSQTFSPQTLIEFDRARQDEMPTRNQQKSAQSSAPKPLGPRSAASNKTGNMKMCSSEAKIPPKFITGSPPVILPKTSPAEYQIRPKNQAEAGEFFRTHAEQYKRPHMQPAWRRDANNHRKSVYYPRDNFHAKSKTLPLEAAKKPPSWDEYASRPRHKRYDWEPQSHRYYAEFPQNGVPYGSTSGSTSKSGAFYGDQTRVFTKARPRERRKPPPPPRAATLINEGMMWSEPSYRGCEPGSPRSQHAGSPRHSSSHQDHAYRNHGELYFIGDPELSKCGQNQFSNHRGPSSPPMESQSYASSRPNTGGDSSYHSESTSTSYFSQLSSHKSLDAPQSNRPAHYPNQPTPWLQHRYPERPPWSGPPHQAHRSALTSRIFSPATLAGYNSHNFWRSAGPPAPRLMNPSVSHEFSAQHGMQFGPPHGFPRLETPPPMNHSIYSHPISLPHRHSVSGHTTHPSMIPELFLNPNDSLIALTTPMSPVDAPPSSTDAKSETNPSQNTEEKVTKKTHHRTGSTTSLSSGKTRTCRHHKNAENSNNGSAVISPHIVTSIPETSMSPTSSGNGLVEIDYRTGEAGHSEVPFGYGDGAGGGGSSQTPNFLRDFGPSDGRLRRARLLDDRLNDMLRGRAGTRMGGGPMWFSTPVVQQKVAVVVGQRFWRS